MQAIVAGTTPTMTFGYSDHFVDYLSGNALVPLDDYINHPVHGIDLDDFVPAFIAENSQYADGLIYSMPFAKSTEMVVYNKTVFDYHDIEFDPSVALTWDDIIDIAENSNILGTGNMQCPYLINIDSAANLFINSSRQWGAGYTNSDGEILIDNPTTREMLAFFTDLFERKIVSFPLAWDGESYGSVPFKRGDVCMSQGSTAGTRHNIPNLGNGRFGIFEMGILPTIQKADGNPASMQQGPNVAIISDATDAERLAAWLLIKHLTSTENTAWFAMETGYIPVRISAFESEEYSAFLGLIDKYETLGLNALTFDERDALPYVQAAAAAYTQIDKFAFDPAFSGRATSSQARRESEFLFESVYGETRTINEAIRRMLNQLGQ
jgi:multiple sugar transport system substrate-binding protein